MEFRYSDELLPAEYSTGGIGGDIPVRCHRDALSEDIGALRAQADWIRLVGPLGDFKGGMAAKYGLIQVAVPECRPERLEVLAYASEIGFLYDDCTEFFSQDEVRMANDAMQSAFNEGIQDGTINRKASGLKAMQSILFERMVEIDRPQAMMAMRLWVEFLQEAAGRQHNAVYKTYEEYIHYRVLDVGEMFWLGLVTFGMGLSIPEPEMRLLRDLTRPCWIVLALQNDICSYQKEYNATVGRDACHMVNAIWVLMKEHQISQEIAENICKQHINSKIAEYKDTIARYRNDKGLSLDTRIYLESLLYTISGDAAWSLITPRYNSAQRYNDMQLSLMEGLFGRQSIRSQDLDCATSTVLGSGPVLEPSKERIPSGFGP